MLVCLLMSAVAGCNSGSGPELTPAVDTFCLAEKPWRPKPGEVARMSDDDVERKLAHNERGAKQCGWQP